MKSPQLRRHNFPASKTTSISLFRFLPFLRRIQFVVSSLWYPGVGALNLRFDSIGNLQQAYFKCAYECFDRRKTQEEIGNCVEYCSVPVLKAHYLVEDETAKFAVKFLLFFTF